MSLEASLANQPTWVRSASSLHQWPVSLATPDPPFAPPQPELTTNTPSLTEG